MLSLGALTPGTFVQRPSVRNKSRYVGDVRLADGRVVVCHLPSLDMGGKMIPGIDVLMKMAVDKKGNPVGPDAMGKFGTPKCEYILRLIRCQEPENAHLGGVWVGAHPSLGESLADQLIRGGTLTEELGGGAIARVQREVTGVGGTDMRTDFLLTHEDGSQTVVEVKTVVDTDYDPASATEGGPVFLGRTDPTTGKYARAAIFPWGGSNQKGPDGEKVVSARAIKHVRELTALAKGDKKTEDGARVAAAVLFVVVRSDATRFRPNEEACPSFARYMREAHAAGVKVLSHQFEWTGDGDAMHLGPLPVDL